MTDRLENLKTLHTVLIDSRNGYDEAFVDAKGQGLSALFREMMAMHSQSADAIAAYLRSLDQVVDDNGSFMSTVNRTVMDVRSMIGGLNESILPGLIDGEERVLGYYDKALATSPPGLPENRALVEQRHALAVKISEIKAKKTLAS